MIRVPVVTVALVALLPLSVAAQHESEHADKAHAANHAAAFGGLTLFHEEAFFTLGAEYTRRQPEWKNWGGTAFAELVFAGEVEFILGATVNYFVNQIVLETGPGLLISHGTEFLWRLGGGYELKSGSMSITPKVFLDFIGGSTAVVLGVSVGRGF